MPTKKSRKKSTAKPFEPETPPEPVNTEESELAYFRRRTDELLRENLRLESEVLCGKAEIVASKMTIKSTLETNARLLTALIADGDALKVYREQALAETKRNIAEHVTDTSDSIWSAFKWEPISHPRP